MEDYNEEMDMPTPCQHCGELFDLLEEVHQEKLIMGRHLLLGLEMFSEQKHLIN